MRVPVARPNRRLGTTKKCEVRDGPFYALRNRLRARFCSRACKGIASRLPEKPCEVCGEMFKPRFGEADRPTCNRECGHAYNRRNGAAKTCEVCGESFYASKGRAKARFRSTACQNTWQGRNETVHTCKVCGGTFRWSPSRAKAYNITYSSLACRDVDP